MSAKVVPAVAHPVPGLQRRVPGASNEPGAPVDVGLRVEVVRDVAGFDALRNDWDDLLARSDATVFQSFEWLRTWWRHFGEPRRDAALHLVTVRDGMGLVAVAPLFIETLSVLGAFRLRRLLFIGRVDSDYLDVLAARGREEPCAVLVAAKLADELDAFDVAVLEDTNERSPIGAPLHDIFLRLGWATSRFQCERCPVTALGPSFEETVAGFGINHRREIRRRLRNIEKEFRVELEVVPPGAEVEPGIRELIDMHQERWARDGISGAFADPRVVGFHADVAPRLAERGWLFLAFLRVDGKRSAGNYGFRFGDAVATFQNGVRQNPALTRFSPGRVLHARSMEWAIVHGHVRYDFMRGPEAYKYEFDAVDVPNWTVIAYPRSPRLNRVKGRVYGVLGVMTRRVARELHALRVAAARDGWLSRGLLAHVSRVFRRGLDDVRRVLAARNGNGGGES